MLSFLVLLAPSAASFPYGGPTFDSFVKESYRVAGRPSPGEFYRTMDARAKAAGLETWGGWAKTHRANGDPKQARAAGEAVWKRIKKTITKFSLDRGFEFVNVTTTNERQCYLQSIIVAGELQKAGYDAGVAMVWANPKGQTSNNGHAVAMIRTKTGDVVIDCSEPYPVEAHKGLFMRMGDSYRYVEPNYSPDRWIVSYNESGRPIRGRPINPSAYTCLDLPFLRSQFDYYRGERALGGVIAKNKTPQGLAASEKFYRRSLEECPSNPLTRTMLSRTLVARGKIAEAEAERKKALEKYVAYGWTPNEVKRPVVAAR